MGQQESVPKTHFKDRNAAVKGLINSEAKYVAHLNKIMKQFMLPLAEKAGKRKTAILPKDRIKIIFGNIEQLADVHKRFLGQFLPNLKEEEEENDAEEEEREMSPKKENLRVGKIFLQHLKDFRKYYFEYVDNYGKAMNMLIESQRKKKKVRKFMEKAALETGTPLSSYLVLPVLRISEYAYILQSLAEQTPEKHPDFEATQSAFEKFQEFSENINDGRRKAETLNQLFLIQLSFVNKLTLVADHRIILREGDVVLEKQAKKKFLSRSSKDQVHFFCSTTSSCLPRKKKTSSKKAKDPAKISNTGSVPKIYRLVTYFPLAKMKFVALPTSSHPNTCELTAGKESYLIRLKSKEEQRAYISVFEKACTEALLFRTVWPKDSLHIRRKAKSGGDKGDASGAAGGGSLGAKSKSRGSFSKAVLGLSKEEDKKKKKKKRKKKGAGDEDDGEVDSDEASEATDWDQTDTETETEMWDEDEWGTEASEIDSDWSDEDGEEFDERRLKRSNSKQVLDRDEDEEEDGGKKRKPSESSGFARANQKKRQGDDDEEEDEEEEEDRGRRPSRGSEDEEDEEEEDGGRGGKRGRRLVDSSDEEDEGTPLMFDSFKSKAMCCVLS